MIPYHIDQQQKAAQMDGAAERYQDNWERGYDDAHQREWNGCQRKSADCSRYCAYLHGYQWGLEERTRHYRSECTSNLATLDTETDCEF